MSNLLINTIAPVLALAMVWVFAQFFIELQSTETTMIWSILSEGMK